MSVTRWLPLDELRELADVLAEDGQFKEAAEVRAVIVRRMERRAAGRAVLSALAGCGRHEGH